MNKTNFWWICKHLEWKWPTPQLCNCYCASSDTLTCCYMTNMSIISHTLCVKWCFLFTKTICVHHVSSVNGSLTSENVRQTFHNTKSQDHQQRHKVVQKCNRGSLHSNLNHIRPAAMCAERTNTSKWWKYGLRQSIPVTWLLIRKDGVYQS